MLIFLALLAAAWTGYWFVRLMLDGDPVLKSNALCSECGSPKHGNNAGTAVKAESTAKPEVVEKANSDAPKQSAKAVIADNPAQAKVRPLFEIPTDKDDLKVIKGIGVVMERTLNDLGIATFKQLAGFNASDVKMVSDALEASNSGFGGRIERDEWVDQAKVITRKAG